MIPPNIQSMEVTAFDASGNVLAGPVAANAPNLSVTLTLANGNNIRFVITAFAAPNGGGTVLYYGETITNLAGGVVTLPVKMNLDVMVTPSQISTVQRGQVIALTGAVSGKAPPASSPLLWRSTGGNIQVLDAYGNNIRWTAPNVLGVFTVDAYIDPNINPDQGSSVLGHSTITVINLAPIAIDDYAFSLNATGVLIPVLNNDSDPENDALTIASVSQGVSGSVVIQGGTSLLYTGNAGATGVDQFTYTIRDALGATATATVFITLNDRQPPVITPPTVITTEATSRLGVAGNTAVIQSFLNAATAIDNVAVANLTNNALSQFGLGLTTVIFTAVDTSGNQATAQSSITVVDTTPPSVTPPANIVVAAVGAAGTPATNASITAFLTAATAVDTVSGNVIATNNATADFAIGTTTVVFSAADGKGNTGTATATVTVVDQTAPIVSPPANTTVAAVDAYGTPVTDPYIQAFINAASANDNVDGAIMPTNNAPAQFPLGVTTVLFTATDAYGNASNASATVTVQNQSAPTVTAPANIVVAAVNATGTAATDPYITAFLGAATAVDLLGNVLPVNHNGATQFALGVSTVTFTAIDANGNTGTATATITISDQTQPLVVAPAAIIVAAVDAYGTPATNPYITAFLGAATASDNVVVAPTISHDAYAQLPLGINTVTFFANDGYGNIGTATATVTVVDQTAPIVSPPANTTVAAVDAYGTPVTDPYIQAFINAASANDNVDGAITPTNNAPAQFPLGVTTVLFTATDAYGNASNASATVTVTPPPNIAPVAVADTFITQNAQLLIYAHSQAVSSTFDNYTEGWLLFNDATNLTHIAIGGNPNGYIQASDIGTGAIWAWQAPAKFLGDQSQAYGNTLSFDLKQSAITSQFTANDDVVLVSNAATLRFNTANNPAINWTHYVVSLLETAGWINTATGLAPSKTTMQNVLTSLTALRIRGEFINGADVGSLDNVVLGNFQTGLLSNDTDANGDLLSMASIDAMTLQGGTITNNNNDSYSYQPAAGFLGTDSFNYSITDGQFTATAAVSITVVNNAFLSTSAAPLSVPADGVSLITVTSQVLDSAAVAVVGKTVNFASSSPYATLSAPTAITDIYGNATVTVTGTLIETAHISSTATTASYSSVAINFNSSAADDDGDGLTNAFEFSIGTNPLDSDTDRDGFTDFQEVNATPATDPLNVTSTPTGATIAAPVSMDSIACTNHAL